MRTNENALTLREQCDERLSRRRDPPATKLVDEVTQLVEVECRCLREKAFDLKLKSLQFVGTGIVSKRLQCGLGRGGLGQEVFVQVSAEDPSKLWKR